MESDRDAGAGPRRRPRPLDVDIWWHTGERSGLRSLFALAEDSPRRLEASIDRGRVLVATEERRIVAYLQLVKCSTTDEMELRSMAVAEDRQREGLGRALVERAISECR